MPTDWNENTKVITDPIKRWEDGLPHHWKSMQVQETIQQVEKEQSSYEYAFGGDGDNGESILYMLDIHFELQEEASQRILQKMGINVATNLTKIT